MSDRATEGFSSVHGDGRPGFMRSALDRWRSFRASLVARPGFRQFAASFPLTRAVARQRTRALFDLAAGFVYSQVLSSFVRLGLVDYLHAAPRNIADIAHHAGLPQPGALRLLKAAIALDLAAEGADGRYRLGETGAALFGNDGVLAMIAHHEMLYEDLADPVALLKGQARTKLQRFWSYAGGDADDRGAASSYSQLMARSQEMVAREVLAVLPLQTHRRLLEIGGGSGAFAIAAARRYPRLRLDLFDLPPVAEIAAGRIEQARLSTQITVHGGNAFEAPLPAGADIATLVRVLHDHDDDAALALLRASHASLAAGGTMVIAEPMAETRGAEPAGHAYFGFYLLAMGQGRPRSWAEIAGMMEQVGFVDIRELPTATPLIVRVAAGRKPA